MKYEMEFRKRTTFPSDTRTLSSSVPDNDATRAARPRVPVSLSLTPQASGSPQLTSASAETKSSAVTDIYLLKAKLKLK